MTVVEGAIRLNLSPWALLIDQFADNSFPREAAEHPEVEYSPNRTSVLTGFAPTLELPNFWNLKCIITRAEYSTLDKMWRQATRNPSTSTLTLDDYTEHFQQSGTRFRRLATSEPTPVADANGWLSYYAQFRVYFVDKPAPSKLGGDKVQVAISLAELEVLAP